MHARWATWLMAVCIQVFPMASHAANWLALFGNESPDAPHIRPIVILQPTYMAVDAEPISGLRGPLSSYNGQYLFNNQVQPDFQKTQQFQFLRARFGARGKLSDNINYAALIEAGSNPMTAQQDVILGTLSVTFNHIPGARIRAGLFKVPTDEEAVLAVHTAYPYTYFSTVVQNLLIEHPVRYTGATANPTISNAQLISGCNCFHDWGIQIYDWFNLGNWELSYAAMVSNGGEIEHFSDRDNNKDLTLRLQASYIFGGKGLHRQEVSVYFWNQNGERRFGSADHERTREGLGFKLAQGKIRLSGAYLRGDGMIVAGFNPPFGGNALAVGINEKSDGWYLEGGWRFHPKWEVDLRQDSYNLMTANAINTRELTTTTLALQHFLRKDIRLSLNYEWRDAKVSHPSAIPDIGPQYQLSNAQAIADNLGDRASFQLTWFY